MNADAATSGPFASLPTAAVNAVWKFVAVTSLVAPIVNSPVFGGVFVDAVSSITSVVPSGISNVNFTLSPAFGLTGKSTLIAGGVPAGPATVAPVSDDVIAFSFKPNGNGSASSENSTVVGAGGGAVKTSRPRPAAPTSACLRSAMICFRPACAPLPSRISPMSATAFVSVARPENR